MKRPPGGRYALLAVCAGLALAAPATQAEAKGFTPHQLPGFENVPWTRLQGDVGKWVRYRVGNEHLQEISFMTLAVVDREEDGRLWVEVRIGRLPDAHAMGGMAVRTLLRPTGEDAFESDRVILRMGGGRVVELDLDTVPERSDDDDLDDEPAMKQAGVCMDPKSESCLRAASRGIGVTPRPMETLLTAAGSMRVQPVEVRLGDGNVLVLRTAEAVPVTGLVSLRAPDGTQMDLDGVGDDARATLPSEAEVVAYDDVTAAMGGGSAPIRAATRIGEFVNPDDARRHAASHGIGEADEADDAEDGP